MTDSTVFPAADDFDFGALDRFAATATSVAVIGHIRPDADAIGSVCALVEVLGNRGIPATGFIGYTGSVDPTLDTLPGFDRVRFTDRLPDEVDTIITVDCGDLGRTGDLCRAVSEFADRGRVAVVDHHGTNRGFGTINLVAVGWESTTMLLWRWLISSGDEITPSVAHNLYAGLVTDTGSFRWGTARMHVMAQAMLAAGIDAAAIATDLLDRTTVPDLAMKGRVMAGMRVVTPGAGLPVLCVLTAGHAVIDGHGVDAVESLCESIRAVEGTDFGVLLKEYVSGTWQISFRSSTHVVSGIARRLGGGGHNFAAGATLREMSADDVIDAITRATADEYGPAGKR